MSKPRASIFADGEVTSLDVTGFAPKSSFDVNAPQPEKIREVSKAAQFTSREPTVPKPEAKNEKRPGRRYRTGRNVQFNVKALAETVDAFYALTDQQGWVLGYTLERAVEALKRELQPHK